MATLNTLTAISIAIMFVSTMSFIASEVAELAIRAHIQSFLMVSISLSFAFLILSLIITRFSSKQIRN